MLSLMPSAFARLRALAASCRRCTSVGSLVLLLCDSDRAGGARRGGGGGGGVTIAAGMDCPAPLAACSCAASMPRATELDGAGLRAAEAADASGLGLTFEAGLKLPTRGGSGLERARDCGAACELGRDGREFARERSPSA